jgi:AraC-like DNA-binding protein
MRSCYDQPLTLQALGDAVGLNRFAVLRGFRRAVGISPHAFLIQVRVERAKQMLAAGIGIATVSQRVGFADQSHLNRHFKRLVGVTPAVYARGVRADAPQ